jgi:hypothetical protein
MYSFQFIIVQVYKIFIQNSPNNNKVIINNIHNDFIIKTKYLPFFIELVLTVIVLRKAFSYIYITQKNLRNCKLLY